MRCGVVDLIENLSDSDSIFRFGIPSPRVSQTVITRGQERSASDTLHRISSSDAFDVLPSLVLFVYLIIVCTEIAEKECVH